MYQTPTFTGEFKWYILTENTYLYWWVKMVRPDWEHLLSLVSLNGTSWLRTPTFTGEFKRYVLTENLVAADAAVLWCLIVVVEADLDDILRHDPFLKIDRVRCVLELGSILVNCCHLYRDDRSGKRKTIIEYNYNNHTAVGKIIVCLPYLWLKAWSWLSNYFIKQFFWLNFV